MQKFSRTLLATGALLASSCGGGRETEQSVEQKNIELKATSTIVLDRSVGDYKNAQTAEKRFFLQFLDIASYNQDGSRWKVGDDCLRETPYTTRDLGIAAIAVVRLSDNTLVISSAGLEDLVFEQQIDKLWPGGTDTERRYTTGVLVAQGCLYGPRIVDYKKYYPFTVEFIQGINYDYSM